MRAFRAVGGTPRFIARAQGPYMWDAEGTRYTDYIGSWGPMILGHGHPAVLEAVQKAALDGFSFGAPTEREVELAEAIIAQVPSVEQVRLVSSGTEAGMSAIRLARGATGRSKIVKFEGCYHGHGDSPPGEGRLRPALTFGVPTSARRAARGQRRPHAHPALQRPRRGSKSAVRRARQKKSPDVIIEPVAGNMNCIPAQVDGYRAGASARAVPRGTGALLDLRRGDDRLPRGAGRGAGRLYRA